MEKVVLQHQASNGNTIVATFLPEKGMNLISYKFNEIEVIDQSTWNLFEERFAGLGALIGPHFHHRKKETIPLVPNEESFPHIARLKAKGIDEPFSHGIARYAPWKVTMTTDNKVTAEISGKDLWHDVSLATLEGQNFKMRLTAEVKENGLFLELNVVSDTASLVGIHYYYALPNGKGKVSSHVREKATLDGQLKNLPTDWYNKEKGLLNFDLINSADYTFRPFPVLNGSILLETELYHLKTNYHCANEENSWQLYHPKEASFVCIEPISAQDPRHANLTSSGLKIHLEITPN